MRPVKLWNRQCAGLLKPRSAGIRTTHRPVRFSESCLVQTEEDQRITSTEAHPWTNHGAECCAFCPILKTRLENFEAGLCKMAESHAVLSQEMKLLRQNVIDINQKL